MLWPFTRYVGSLATAALFAISVSWTSSPDQTPDYIIGSAHLNVFRVVLAVIVFVVVFSFLLWITRPLHVPEN